METVIVNIDWQSEKSIELAEMQKAELENSGYTLINNFGGMNASVLVYGKM